MTVNLLSFFTFISTSTDVHTSTLTTGHSWLCGGHRRPDPQLGDGLWWRRPLVGVCGTLQDVRRGEWREDSPWFGKSSCEYIFFAVKCFVHMQFGFNQPCSLMIPHVLCQSAFKAYPMNTAARILLFHAFYAWLNLPSPVCTQSLSPRQLLTLASSNGSGSAPLSTRSEFTAASTLQEIPYSCLAKRLGSPSATAPYK